MSFHPAMALLATTAFAIYLVGVLIVRDVAREKGYRYNLWAVVVASTVNAGLVAFVIRSYLDEREVLSR